MVAVVGALSNITQLTWSKSFEYLVRACYLNDYFGHSPAIWSVSMAILWLGFRAVMGPWSAPFRRLQNKQTKIM
jgi:hypothetical protein